MVFVIGRRSDGAMFVSILILIPWVALLLLILHDATKEEIDGSAFSITAKNFKAFIYWAMQKSTLTVKASKVITVKAISPSSKPSVPNETELAQSTKKWWHKERRVSITTAELELAISEAVKRTAPGCEDFVGVIVQKKKPQLHLNSNWTIRGAKFGNADRKLADKALATVVERMQRDFLLSDD